jgi:hypothetical protein
VYFDLEHLRAMALGNHNPQLSIVVEPVVAVGISRPLKYPFEVLVIVFDIL